MPVVQMPDGQLVELPDNPSPELKAAIQAKIAAAKQPESSGDQLVQKLKSYGGDILRGGAKGLAMLAEGAAAFNSADRGVLSKENGKTTVRPSEGPDGSLMRAADESVKKDPTANPYRTAAMEAVGGQLVMPIGGVGLKSLLTSMGGGLGSEVAAKTFGDNAGTRLVGGLAGGAGTGYGLSKIGAPRIQEASIAKEALEGITPEQLRMAQQMQEQARKLGVNLDLSQALTATGASPNNLNTIRDLIANTKEGNKTQTLLRNQPTELNEATRLKAAEIPGRDFGLEQAGLNAKEAATSVINMEKAARSAAVRPNYEAAGNLGADVRRQFAAAISEAMQKPGTTPDAAEAMRTALAQLKVSPSTGAGMTHALDYDTLINTLNGPFKGTPLSPANPKSAGQVKALAAQLNATLKQASPELAAAEAKFAQISNDVVNPLKQGPVGQVAGRGGYLGDSSVASQRVYKFLDEGVSPSQPNSPIRTLGQQLGRADPEAFQDSFKSWLMSKIDKHSAADLTPGQAQPDALAKGLYDELVRSPKRYQGIKDAVSVIAEQSGQNPADVVRGLDNLAKVIKGAANRPQSTRGISPEQLQDMAGSSLSANALRVFGFLPFERLARSAEMRQATATFKTFDELLTSPEGAVTLARLGKTSPMSPAFGALLQGFETGAIQGYSASEEVKRRNGQ